MPDTTAPQLPPSQRGLSLAAAIASVAVFGIGIGDSALLLSLLLETHGTDVALNGVNAAVTFIGVMLGPWIAPHGVRRCGITNFLLLCFALDIILFLSMKAFSGIGPWFLLRFLLGLVGSNIFTTSEAWINLLSAGAGRGRIVGLYAGVLSAGIGIGPLILSVTGVAGWARSSPMRSSPPSPHCRCWRCAAAGRSSRRNSRPRYDPSSLARR